MQLKSWFFSTAKVVALTAGLVGALTVVSACQPATESAYQTPAAVPAEQTEAPWWDDAVFYQIWPRSFYDTTGDGHGDFNGMTAKLPYLSELGIDAIWLTPMFEAPSYHGYDFTEFYQVESDYGSMADFERFLNEAEARGIRVILDLVINHISREHQWFQRSAERVEPYSDYFIWREELPASGKGWGHAWSDNDLPEAVWHFDETRGEYYYAAFGATQPDLNLEHPDVIEEMKRMAKFWLDKGVDGFRLDAVRFVIERGPQGQADLPETIDYWKDFNAFVKSVNPEAYLVGEAWVDIPVAAKYWGDGKGLDQGFDFEFGYIVLDMLQQGLATEAQFGTMSQQSGQVADGELHPLAQNVQRRLESGAPLAFFTPFLTNHDQDRVGFQLQENQAKAKQAAALLFSSPGTKYIYYGEEIGMTQQQSGHDVYKRAPMLWDQSHQAGFTQAELSWVQQNELFTQAFDPWWPDFLAQQLAAGDRTVAAQRAQPDSLWQLHRLLIAMQKQRPEMRLAGSYQVQSPLQGILTVTRELGEQRSVFVLNLAGEMVDIAAVLAEHSGLAMSWGFDLDGSLLATDGLLILQSR
ncbi:alpha-amylase family glycosyl hydrolase [Alkalimonas sp.]|uniref:alpha-amylase family glycosyl hydrolase n=1 Tax=Alkalimonas sp. TaxID=1872453 RepID=UPI00263B2E17|nr:alpha-amylase family glycosyl hydrolase [Alkalimonas sp.]MCC5827274.1 alpha-amylase [Alkalimonas sp.]